MTITKIHINHLQTPSSRLLATATIIIDGVFAINDIKVIKTDNKLCIAFPKESSAKKQGKETMAPLNVATRSYIENAVLDKYREVLLKT